MGIVEYLILLVISVISFLGYFGLIILMALESMVFPLPSELVMPFAGFLVFQGKFDFWLVVLFATIGTIVGSLISYYVGYYLGKPFVNKFGKYFFLDQSHLDSTEKFFKKHGDKTIFISRFIPVVRHIISIPAGFGKMKLWKFIVYTFAGGFLWNGFLTYVGFKLGENWGIVHKYSTIIDIIVFVIVVVVIVWYIAKRYKNAKEKNKTKKRK
jgi:membrane protein DedA with SNARE-associated domain